MTPLEKRRAQNLAAVRPDARSVTPSTRSFALAIDRQRQGVERIPTFAAARPGLREVCRALDEAEVAALALFLDDAPAELSAFAAAAQEVSVPVLRCDLLLEEFQLYESRLAGADAVLLVARLLPGEQLPRLTSLAHGTHLSTCVLCESEADLARALAARASVLALPLRESGLPDEALWARVPPRALVLAVPPLPWLATHSAPAPTHSPPRETHSASRETHSLTRDADSDSAPAHAAQTHAAPLQLGALRGRCDAALDLALAAAPDPAQAFRAALSED